MPSCADKLLVDEGGRQLNINNASAGETASLIYQWGYTVQAEFILYGNGGPRRDPVCAIVGLIARTRMHIR